MMRSFDHRILLALAVLGCGAPRGVQPAEAQSAAAPGPKLHLAGDFYAGFKNDPPSPEPCTISGRTFICGTSLGMASGKIEDVGISIPLASRYLGGAVGKLPDGLWTLRAAQPPRVNERGPVIEVARWQSQQKAWVAVADVPVSSPFSVADDVRICSWWPGRVLVIETIRSVAGGGPPRQFNVWSYGEGAERPLPALAGADGQTLFDDFWSLSCDESGRVEMVGSKRGTPEQRFVWAPGVSQAEAQPFRAEAKSGGPLPRWGQRIVSYAAEPSGTDWVIMGTVPGESDPTVTAIAVFRRAPQADWQPVELPLVPKLLAGTKVRYQAADVWADGDDDVWLRVALIDACGQRRTALFHSTPVQTICRLEASKNSCEAIDEGQVFGTWRCQR
jgi:hypothetical protein